MSVRTDKEYILMGKIQEKQNELLELQAMLEELEFQRSSEQTVNEETQEETQKETQKETHEEYIEPVEPRKPISIDKRIKLIENERELAEEISSGRYKNVKWGSKNYVASWSKGRKHDPLNYKVGMLRTQLRQCPKSIRDLSTHTALSIKTVQDLVREMDRQGFFTNT
jgi:hypothetical protein